jgi:sodium-dependent dicarboxylate transporter 2/3/5
VRRGLWLGPLAAALALLFAHGQGLAAPACWTAAVTALCAVWWILEPVPIPATALVPFAAFPLLGVLTHEEVAHAYGHTLILLFLGGFLLSAAMERSGTHLRLAVALLRLLGGTSARSLVLGFMLASWSLSMWISNTATVLMLLPMTVAVLERVRDERLAGALLLGVAYGSSIGGLGTPVGSPPNVVYMAIYQETTGRAVGFAEWMAVGVPVAVVFVALAWLLLTRGLRGGHEVELPQPGRWRAAELRTLAVFALAAAAWVTRENPFGGWSAWLGVPGAGDSTVALLAAVVLFVCPDGRGGRLVEWADAQRLPWGVLLLFGGGIAIAKAFTASGLSHALGAALSGITAWPTAWMVLAVCLVVTFLTEVTSNTATATALLPLLAATGLAGGIEPALLMLPAALSASCAFMLPVGTPPNAIVFGTGRVSMRRMAREGLLLNFVGAAVIAAACLLALG